MNSALREIARNQQGNPRDAMPYHEWDSRASLLGECKELRRKLAHKIAIERGVARNPETIENREQQQRVFRGFSKGFRSLDQQISLIERCFGIG